jgi:hypothetical protein
MIQLSPERVNKRPKSLRLLDDAEDACQLDKTVTFLSSDIYQIAQYFRQKLTILCFNNQQFPVLPAKCIYRFHTILTVNCDNFLKQHEPVDLCNGEVLCFLCGTDRIIKYYSDELQLQTVKGKLLRQTENVAEVGKQEMCLGFT